MKVGVLALKGDFLEHIHILESLGVDAVEVRKPEQLRDIFDRHAACAASA